MYRSRALTSVARRAAAPVGKRTYATPTPVGTTPVAPGTGAPLNTPGGIPRHPAPEPLPTPQGGNGGSNTGLLAVIAIAGAGAAYYFLATDPEARAKAKELSDKAKAEAHDISAKAKSEARQLSSDVKSEAHKLSGDLQNLGHSASGQAKGAYYDAKAAGQDALAKGEHKTGAAGYLEQAEQKGKSLLSSARASGERGAGEAEGTLTELKENVKSMFK
ncbi:hypothetical protein NCC49_002780 [Naganishia albida]|nr:hypothetical protein NCC49_002780 [Naganishia albida]